MTGYIDTNTTLDAVDGDRISLEQFHKGHSALLTVEEYEDEDGRLIEKASVLLRPIQLRALAALCLISAEELERERQS